MHISKGITHHQKKKKQIMYTSSTQMILLEKLELNAATVCPDIAVISFRSKMKESCTVFEPTPVN